MPYTIPNTFATREDTVRLSLLDQNFSSVATQINTLTGTVDLLGGGSTETFTALQNDIAAVSSSSFKAGMIVMWSGSIATIPTGWVLCDGSNSTPDLRDRFIVGAGTTYAVAATGGSKDAVVVSHTHTVSDPGHAHNIRNAVTNFGSTAGSISLTGSGGGMLATVVASTGISIAEAGVSGTNANLPPYYALAFIMKT
jgi:hypothetical protein